MALAQRVNEKTCSALRETFGEKSAFLEQLAQQLLTRKTKTDRHPGKQRKRYAVHL